MSDDLVKSIEKFSSDPKNRTNLGFSGGYWVNQNVYHIDIMETQAANHPIRFGMGLAQHTGQKPKYNRNPSESGIVTYLLGNASVEVEYKKGITQDAQSLDATNLTFTKTTPIR